MSSNPACLLQFASMEYRLKLYKNSCHLNNTKHYFSQRIISLWNSLSNHMLWQLFLSTDSSRWLHRRQEAQLSQRDRAAPCL